MPRADFERHGSVSMFAVGAAGNGPDRQLVLVVPAAFARRTASEFSCPVSCNSGVPPLRGSGYIVFVT